MRDRSFIKDILGLRGHVADHPFISGRVSPEIFHARSVSVEPFRYLCERVLVGIPKTIQIFDRKCRSPFSVVRDGQASLGPLHQVAIDKLS